MQHISAIDIAQQALWLDGFARRHYVMQPPLFKASAVALADSLKVDATAAVYLVETSNVYFGFPRLSTGAALIQALQLAKHADIQIEVGAKADPQFDAVFASMPTHNSDPQLIRLLNSAVAFFGIDAYAAVYATNPARLLQPALRVREGYACFNAPNNDQVEWFRAQLAKVTTGDA
jgi:hypothetical protein